MKKLSKKITNISRVIRRSTKAGMHSFTQTPSENQFKGLPGSQKKDMMEGAELFSRFTADIIKKDVVFTR